MTKTKTSSKIKLTSIITATVLVGVIFLLGPGILNNAEASHPPGVAIDFLACRPTGTPDSGFFNPGAPICDLQSGNALNDLVSVAPAGPLVVLEPNTNVHQAEWESAPLTAPLTLLPGPVTLDLVLVNLAENAGTNDICWSKHAHLPDGSQLDIVSFHCFENPLPVAGFICPFGAVAPNIPQACLNAAGLVSETVVSNILAPTVLPIGTVIELSVACPGSSFLGVFFNAGFDVDGDGIDEFSKLTEPVQLPADPRTKGFWKNHEDETTEHLPITIGDLDVNDFDTATDVFNVSAKNAHDMLAAQLLAAEINVWHGVPSCDEVDDAISDAQEELVDADYEGPGTTNPPKKGDKGAVNAIKDVLDDFNNNGCS